MRTPHTSCFRGKRVLVILKDGTRIVDKFVERAGRHVVLQSRRLRGEQIRAFTIYRATT